MWLDFARTYLVLNDGLQARTGIRKRIGCEVIGGVGWSGEGHD